MKVIILGSNGFIGKNLSNSLCECVNLIQSSRYLDQTIHHTDQIFFDLTRQETWNEVEKIKSDFIINCIGYGADRKQTDKNKMLEINYILTCKFYQYLIEKKSQSKIIHLGSAYEYEMSSEGVTEITPLRPLGPYGVSKAMASEYIRQSSSYQRLFKIFRLFNIFGPYESKGKLTRTLIESQIQKKVVQLTAGRQNKDFVFIGDFCNFVKNMIFSWNWVDYPTEINIGSGVSMSIRQYADTLAKVIPACDLSLWNWGECFMRQDEGNGLFNASNLSVEYGIKYSDLIESLKYTFSHYNA